MGPDGSGEHAAKRRRILTLAVLARRRVLGRRLALRRSEWDERTFWRWWFAVVVGVDLGVWIYILVDIFSQS